MLRVHNILIWNLDSNGLRILQAMLIMIYYTNRNANVLCVDNPPDNNIGTRDFIYEKYYNMFIFKYYNIMLQVYYIIFNGDCF